MLPLHGDCQPYFWPALSILPALALKSRPAVWTSSFSKAKWLAPARSTGRTSGGGYGFRLAAEKSERQRMRGLHGPGLKVLIVLTGSHFRSILYAAT